MANGAALINEGLWRKDKDFQRLPRLAQCTFCQLLSQKDLDTAGGLTLHLELMAKACDELTVEQLTADLAILEERQFVFVDYDTDELLVRSYVRLVSSVGGTKNNAWRSVPKNAKLIASEKLRSVLAAELRRLRWKQADELADEIDPLGPHSGPPSDPVGTRSEGPTPSEGGSDPHSSVPVPVLVSPSVVGSVGERRPECPDHEENSDTDCRPCMRRRIWDESHAADELDQKRRQREALAERTRNCQICHGTGQVEIDENTVRPCVCREVQHA